MKHRVRDITFVAVAAFLVGCTSTDASSVAGAPQRSDNATTQVDKAKPEGTDAVQGYAYAQKDAFVAEMRRELGDVQQEVARLSALVDSYSGTAMADTKAKLAVASEKWEKAKKQLDRAEGATEVTWEEAKASFNTSFHELKEWMK
jgi:hypothetical protein